MQGQEVEHLRGVEMKVYLTEYVAKKPRLCMEGRNYHARSMLFFAISFLAFLVRLCYHVRTGQKALRSAIAERDSCDPPA